SGGTLTALLRAAAGAPLDSPAGTTPAGTTRAGTTRAGTTRAGPTPAGAPWHRSGQRLLQDLGHVQHPDGLRDRPLGLAAFGRSVEHDQAVGTGGGHHVGPGGQGLVRALDVDPFADALLDPHAGPAGAAAEAGPTVAVHLGQLDPWNVMKDTARLVVDLVVPAQITGVVVSHFASARRPSRRRPQPGVGQQLL